MFDDRHNLIPFAMALALHVVVFGSMLVAIDWSRNVPPVVPLAVKATLITESAVVVPPRPEPRRPEPQPAPEPEVVEPEVVEPDPAEQARVQAEEQARLEEARREQQRIEREQEAERERQRQAELERERRAEAERKAREEAELERQRAEAERRRQEDIERQRQENLREEQRLQEELRQAEIAAEAERLEAMNSTEMQMYQAAIKQKIERNWIQPASAPDDLECFVAVRQLPNGEVVSVRIQQCNGDDVARRSIEAAVRRASPLPLPSNPILFLSDFTFKFTIPE